ncbi:MAG: pyridoxal phosphate-dependent aminotransferase [Deltaproteobacteria bacterium]|nr:pyridoxal phosphate-dependent aminotransferase [Deltaproteobacteria bacterium]
MPRPPHASSTTQTLSGSVFGSLLARAKRRGLPVHPLHVGDTYKDPIPEARAEAQLSSEHAGLHRYAPPQGLPELLDAVVERERERAGVELSREDVQIMSGATAGLSVIAQALFDPGDEVLLPSPYWPLIRGIIASRGAVAVEVPCFHALGELDVEALFEAQVTPRTVALYLNNPHNPTGCVLPEDALEAILRVVERHDLWLICDEAYEELYFGQAPRPIWAREALHERAIVSHTFSKSYGMAGARVGYVHGPASAMRAIRGVQTFLTYCAPRPMQYAALACLRHGQGFIEECRRDYAEAGARAAELLGVAPPEGGTFLFFDASPCGRRDESALPRALRGRGRAADAGLRLRRRLPALGAHLLLGGGPRRLRAGARGCAPRHGTGVSGDASVMSNVGVLALSVLAACAGAAPPSARTAARSQTSSSPSCAELVLTRRDERALGLVEAVTPEQDAASRELLASPSQARESLLARFRSEWSGSALNVEFDHASLRLRGPEPQVERACVLSRSIFDQARRHAAAASAEFLVSELRRLQVVADDATTALDAFEREHPLAAQSSADALTRRRLSRELETQAVLLTEVQGRLRDAAQVRASGLESGSECRPVVCDE